MSEATTEPVTTETVVVEDDATKQKPTDTVDYWKQKSRENEARAKSNADKAKELDALKESQKTETQKQLDAQAAAEKRATDAETRALRLEVAAAKGLTPEQAKRLIGTTQQELEADADDLLATFKSSTDGTAGVADSLDLGSRGKPAATSSPAGDFAAFMKRI
jgi:ATPase subunit of ABC transporter with duplicated ATPase domains